MKKLLVALGFAFASFGAQADALSMVGAGTDAITKLFNPKDASNVNLLSLPVGTIFETGSLHATHEGTFYATFFGSESGYLNFYMDNATTIIETGANIGTTASMYVAGPGLLDFGFGTLNPAFQPGINNGDPNGTDLGIGFLKNVWGFKDEDNNAFEYLVGFNDAAAGVFDFDDMVMGVRFVPTPVPAALPLLATGLALFGFSRRKGV